MMRRALWVAVILLATIGVAVATRRGIVVVRPGAVEAAEDPGAGVGGPFGTGKGAAVVGVLPGSIFLLALGRALWHAMRGEFAQHREWMIRGYAVGLAVATIRPIMGGFFAAAAMRGATPEPSTFFGKAFWIGFTLQTLAAEIWV